MVAEIGIWKVLRPAVENLGQGGTLPTSSRQVLFQDEHQDYVTLRSEVRHILGDDSPALRPGRRGDLAVIGGPQACLGDVNGILSIAIAQQSGRGHREHLIDQERRHARRASRCRAILRLRSVMARLRSIRSLISSRCSAA